MTHFARLAGLAACTALALALPACNNETPAENQVEAQADAIDKAYDADAAMAEASAKGTAAEKQAEKQAASSLGGGLLLTLTGAGGFFGCIAAVLLFTFASVLAVRRQITASRPLPAPGPGTAESSDPGTRISDGSLRTPRPAYPPRR